MTDDDDDDDVATSMGMHFCSVGGARDVQYVGYERYSIYAMIALMCVFATTIQAAYHSAKAFSKQLQCVTGIVRIVTSQQPLCPILANYLFQPAAHQFAHTQHEILGSIYYSGFQGWHQR
jgi:hypothetical protein